ncbi:MAG: hypothetical protein ACXWUG_29775 [Polyangiales bacterium]
MKVDATLKRLWTRAHASLQQATSEGMRAFDRKYEALGDIPDRGLFSGDVDRSGAITRKVSGPMHGHPRATEDLDVPIRARRDCLRRERACRTSLDAI